MEFNYSQTEINRLFNEYKNLENNPRLFKNNELLYQYENAEIKFVNAIRNSLIKQSKNEFIKEQKINNEILSSIPKKLKFNEYNKKQKIAKHRSFIRDSIIRDRRRVAQENYKKRTEDERIKQRLLRQKFRKEISTNKNKSVPIEIIRDILDMYYENELKEKKNINIQYLFDLLYCIKILDCIKKFKPTITIDDLEYLPENMREIIKKM